MDKISIIVPVYNNYNFLDKCLDSIINQTYKNIEIILINDGSTDDSKKKLKDYAKEDSRIILIDKKNEGVSKARNNGIKISTGKYITFVDSDDYLECDAIEKMYNALIKNKVDLIRANYQVHYKESDKVDVGDLFLIGNKKYNNKQIKNDIVPEILSGKLPCFVYLLLIKRDLLLSTSLFPTDIHMMEDVVFYLDLLTKTNNFYILNEVVYNIYFNENGATNNKKNYERNINNVISVNKYIKKILEDKKLNMSSNIELLDVANCEAISDFIFKQYLYGDNVIDICRKLSINDDFIKIYKGCNKDRINFQRKIILNLIVKKKFMLLRMFFKIRKILKKMRG